MAQTGLGKEQNHDISIVKLINYNILLFLPILLLYVMCYFFAGILSPAIKLPQNITADVLMIILSLIFFFMVIPFLRARETVRGVRFSLFNFIFFGIIFTIPSIIMGNYDLLMSTLIYLANFIFATFLICPDVIGISGDPDDWFKHTAQVLIFCVYLTIILLYALGFGWIYYEIATSEEYPNAFTYSTTEHITYPTFIYFSVVTLATAGYGDISPLSLGAQLIVGLEILIAMIMNVVFIATLVMYVSFSAQSVGKTIQDRIEKEEEKIEKEELRIIKDEQEISQRQDRILRMDPIHSGEVSRFAGFKR